MMLCCDMICRKEYSSLNSLALEPLKISELSDDPKIEGSIFQLMEIGLIEYWFTIALS